MPMPNARVPFGSEWLIGRVTKRLPWVVFVLITDGPMTGRELEFYPADVYVC